MKRNHIKLAAATAISLVMGASAYADDSNKAYIDQGGDTNTALIDQAGGTGNRAGRSAQRVTQDGDDNTLTIIQSGTGGNKFGTTSNDNSGSVIQTGSRNVLDAEQNGDRNQAATVLQTAPGGLSGPSNVATIRQLGNFGGIGTVTQSSAVSSTSVMNTATLTQKGGNSIKIGTVDQEFTGVSGDTGNDITIFQNGPTNNVGIARQLGHDNTVDISQSGGRTNKVALADQIGHGNTSSLYFTGNYNGNSDLALGTFAAMSGAASSTSYQNGIDNTISLTAIGDSNLFGFNQSGDFNSAVGTVNGNSNQLAIAHLGSSNVTNFEQSGDGNDAGFYVDGDNNHLDIRQNQSGASGNNMGVSIVGDDNNATGGKSPGFSGDAEFARDVVRTAGLGASDFARGDLWQEGSNNTLRGAALGSPLTVEGDGNSFATYQNGNDNTIVGAIDGGSNQAVVAQIGNGNLADMSQTGNGNNLGISQ
ncbi:hypothetical protein [Hoeflea ulvae]|uniref:Curlin n=1 Tax=Hoeflea ulvae TaxID=2983764 RepID=A0ABT3YDV8_9HYPH|nr:hypothetical protein [Hoeflea ulvae]MCY0094038.1 hypothetical protein [Hoeflea ulvae]